MARIETSTLPSGLPVHRIEIEGTRATTVLVAFDAGARTERPEENGMAHFLEHLVFKGGQKYDDYRKVNETAERMGAVLNAYTSHDLVAGRGGPARWPESTRCSTSNPITRRC